MHLKFINDFEQISSQREEWDAAAGPFPFFRWNWMANWFKCMGQDLELALLVAVDESDNWIGIAPWCIDSKTFSRRLRFLGSGTACSDYLDLICQPQYSRKFAEAASDWIVDNVGNPNTLGRLDAIDFEGITTSNPITQYLCDLLDAHGLQSHSNELEGGWAVDLPSTWDELNSSFSKSMRRKTKKAVQRLADDSTQIVSTKNQPLETLWPIFVDLHQRRRNMVGQAGCFADSNFDDFLYQASKGLVAEGKAELTVIKRDNIPFAAMLLLNDDDCVYMYQSGMDCQRLNLEPGYQIATHSIRNSIELGFKKFDFLRGDEPYKARWNTSRIPISRTRFIPSSSVAKIKHSIWLTGKSLKLRFTSGVPESSSDSDT